MIQYDKKTNSITVSQIVSWSWVKDILKQIKDHFGERYEADEFDEDDAANIEKFLNWDPEKDLTPTYKTDYTDLMQNVADSLQNDEDEEGFSITLATEDAVCRWVSDEFEFDILPEEVFRDGRAGYYNE